MGNLQTFTGNLGGISPPPVTAAGNGKFQVQGNALFNDLQSALQRSWYAVTIYFEAAR